jgi:dCMP deaminase
VRTIHAELNAIISAAKDGVSIAYSTAYITSKPCLNCLKSLINAGVKKIFFAEDYGDVDYSVLGMNNNVMPDIVMLGPTGRTPVNIRDAGRSRHD